MNIKLPELNIFEKYDHVNPMKQLPRPQPSDYIVNLFGHVKEGFFIDVGAYDGVTCSNSCVLEEGYNWKGICIEPNPISFTQLKKYRNCTLLNLGVSQQEKKLDFWSITGYASQLSGFVNYFSKEHKDRIHSDVKKHGGDIDIRLIQSKKLQSILDEQNITKIDYLSVDCECADLEVLSSIDFDKTDISVISHEYQDDVIQREELDKFLVSKGYKFLDRVCNDLIYKK